MAAYLITDVSHLRYYGLQHNQFQTNDKINGHYLISLILFFFSLKTLRRRSQRLCSFCIYPSLQNVSNLTDILHSEFHYIYLLFLTFPRLSSPFRYFGTATYLAFWFGQRLLKTKKGKQRTSLDVLLSYMWQNICQNWMQALWYFGHFSLFLFSAVDITESGLTSVFL